MKVALGVMMMMLVVLAMIVAAGAITQPHKTTVPMASDRSMMPVLEGPAGTIILPYTEVNAKWYQPPSAKTKAAFYRRRQASDVASEYPLDELAALNTIANHWPDGIGLLSPRCSPELGNTDAGGYPRGDPLALYQHVWNCNSTCIKCDADQRVVGIWLHEPSESAVPAAPISAKDFPTGVCDFPGIETISMVGMMMTGGLPDCICNLTALSKLSLQMNAMDMNLPFCLEGLSELTTLELVGNEASNTTFPPVLCTLTQLTTLNLERSSFVGSIPSCIKSLTNLNDLLLIGNKFIGPVPLELCELKNLTTLFAGVPNQMTGSIPECLGGLSALTGLDLGSNRLSGEIPDALCQLSALTGLWLDGNQLTGIIPSCFGTMSSLTSIDLHANRLGGDFPASLCSLSRLSSLLLFSNEFTGTIPSCLNQLSQLSQLLVNDNLFEGEIPFESVICSLSRLEILWMGGSDFYDAAPIPDCLCSLTSLRRLNLRATNRNGSMPNCLGNLDRLVNLTLSDNPDLSGAIPESLCDTKYLQGLFLGGNKGLVTHLPKCIGRLTSLSELDMTDVPILGPLPSSLFSLYSLKYLILSGVQDAGPFPHDIVYQCPNNTCPLLYLHDPATGTYDPIPKYITTGSTLPWLPNIQLLAIVNSGISGSIPSWLTNSTTAKSIVLNGNLISGTIPKFVTTTIGKTLTQFEAADNLLTGVLDNLALLPKLTQLDLSHNNLAGYIPAGLAGRTSSMTTLILEDNHLSCSIPENVSIASGGTLNILRNNLFGCPLPKGVLIHDPSAPSYACGSNYMQFALEVFGCAVLVVLVAISIAAYISPRKPNRDDSPIPTPQAGGYDLNYAKAYLTLCILWAFVLAPVFLTAPSQLGCRYLWRWTAAYLQPANTNDPAWIVVLLVVGGLGGGLIITFMMMLPGIREARLKNPRISKKTSINWTRWLCLRPSQWQKELWQWTLVVLLAIVWNILNFGISVAFVYCMSSRFTDSTFLQTDGKRSIIIVYAIIHELLIHLVKPWVVFHSLDILPKRYHKRPNAHILAMLLGVVTSVIAPLVALMIGSESCLPLLVPAERVVTTAAISKTTCTFFYDIPGNETGYAPVCATFSTGPSLTYTDPITFSPERCVSDLIVVFSPAYVMIFAIRLLLLPFLYYLFFFHPGALTLGYIKWDQLFIVGVPQKVPDGTDPDEWIAARREQRWRRVVFRTWSSTFALNCIAIGFCAGLGSPMVALIGFVCILLRPLIFFSLDRFRIHRFKTDAALGIDSSKQGPCAREIEEYRSWYFYKVKGQSLPLKFGTSSKQGFAPSNKMQEDNSLTEKLLESEDVDERDEILYGRHLPFAARASELDHPDNPTAANRFDDHPLPVAVAAMILFFHSVYIVIYAIGGDLGGWGGAVVVVNWIVFYTVWWQYDPKPRGT